MVRWIFELVVLSYAQPFQGLGNFAERVSCIIHVKSCCCRPAVRYCKIGCRTDNPCELANLEMLNEFLELNTHSSNQLNAAVLGGDRSLPHVAQNVQFGDKIRVFDNRAYGRQSIAGFNLIEMPDENTIDLWVYVKGIGHNFTVGGLSRRPAPRRPRPANGTCRRSVRCPPMRRYRRARACRPPG